MRTNLWFGVMALAIIFAAFVSVPVSADDAPPKDEAALATEVDAQAKKLTAEMELLRMKYSAICQWDVSNNPHVDAKENLEQMLRLSFSPGSTPTDEEWILISDLMYVRLDICSNLKANAFFSVYDPEAEKDSAKVEGARKAVAEFESGATAYINDYQRLLKKCFPFSDLVEPLRKEFKECCHWKHDEAWLDLRYMYVIADNGNVFGDEEKKALDDLGVRHERGCARESKLRQLLWDWDAMSDPVKIAEAKRLLVDFKRMTEDWLDDYLRLREKVLPNGITNREQRVRDAAKALDNPNPSQPK